MLTLVFVIIFGVLFSYFATINTGIIAINFGFYQLEYVPIYMAILVSAAMGIMLAVLFHLMRYLSDSLTIGDKEKDIKAANKRIAELSKDVHKLELENMKLKSEQGEKDIDEDSLD